MKTIRINRGKWGTRTGKMHARPVSALMIFVAGIALAALLYGCMPCYYAPGAQNVPLFTEKKQANLSGAYKIGMYTQGCDFQTAVAVADHAALMANYSYFAGKDATPRNNDSYTDRFHGHTVDIGMGYYLPIADKFVFETFAGYGANKVMNEYQESYGSGNSSLHSSSFFLQPAIGFYKKNVELAVSTRFRLVNYDKVEFTSNVSGETSSILIDLDDNPLNCFLEPAFTARMGGEIVKVQIQVGISAHLNRESLLEYDPFNANFGLIFQIRGKKEPEVEIK